ncbi:MAG: Peptide transporter permease [Thermodesulfobacteriota bacterium]|nr:Peptide transporter permease [Thermodesulfobacteriota bacterium]
MTHNQYTLESPSAPRRTRLRELWQLFRENKLAILGLIIFVLFFMTAVSGVILTSGQRPVFDPAMVRLQEKLLPPLTRPHLESLHPTEVPTLGIYLFGTDDLGRDVFARMLQGAWVSLTVGFVAVGISVLVGIFMGGIAGYFGQEYICLDHILIAFILSAGGTLLSIGSIGSGSACLGVGLLCIVYRLFSKILGEKLQSPGLLHKKAISIDTIIMRAVDIMLCFPSFFLILTVVALVPASMYNIMIVIGLTSWMGTTRFVRAEFLSLREQDFVTAAKALGVGNFRIIFRHMMPNAVAPVLVSATIGIATAILTEAGLSFLGFGVPPPHATWGNILSDGKRFIFDAPWLTFIPGIGILIVVLCFNLFGEGLRDAMNPKLRERG